MGCSVISKELMNAVLTIFQWVLYYSDNSKETFFLIQGKLIALKYECNLYINVKLIFPRHLILIM